MQTEKIEKTTLSNNFPTQNFTPEQKNDIQHENMQPEKERKSNDKILSEYIENSDSIKNTDESKIETRYLRSMTVTGQTIRRNYADLAGFNPRRFIRKAKIGMAVNTAVEGPISGNFYINSQEFSNIAQLLIMRNGDDELPNSIEEARKSRDSIHWEDAIQRELNTLKEKCTWKLVDPPNEMNIIGNRLVFTKKFDEDGKLCKYKARLVAQGYSQG
ncbi:hypothetical protein GcC1_192021 [Golovinomyces cichoracearum]|uniref:Reverse transcriptase Ty1/copia-type domain-containing protein n=1 Tax=Golovinomyces cichoracearum TaxID=62708 RepID=A0A420HI18_9PEZI|nr:hypothetical protein GcC1_192021 [Golovinomyces cichoracearum]